MLQEIKDRNIATYLDYVKEAERVKEATKEKISKGKAYTVKEMTALLKPKKRKEDGRMPINKRDVIVDLICG